MRVLVCGPRDCESLVEVHAHLAAQFLMTKGVELIHGHANGVDRIADVWARAYGVPRFIYPADWKKHGRAAGPIRNQKMLDEGKPDLVLAFQYKDRKTPGTQDMIRRAKKANVKVQVVELAVC